MATKKEEELKQGDVNTANAANVASAEVNPPVQEEGLLSFGEVRVENQLKFKPRPELNNLCIGQLISVEVIKAEAPKFDESTGIEKTWEYAGYVIPRIILKFKQKPTQQDPKERIHTHEEKVIGALKGDGTEIDPKVVASLYNSMYARLQHICNAYKHLANYADITAPGINPFAPIETRVAQLERFFNHFATVLAGKDGKGVYRNVDVWLKVVADFKSGKYLRFPEFVGEGFIERWVANQVPSIEIKPNEGIELVAGAKGKGKGPKGSNAAATAEEHVADDIMDMVNKYNK